MTSFISVSFRSALYEVDCVALRGCCRPYRPISSHIMAVSHVICHTAQPHQFTSLLTQTGKTRPRPSTNIRHGCFGNWRRMTAVRGQLRVMQHLNDDCSTLAHCGRVQSLKHYWRREYRCHNLKSIIMMLRGLKQGRLHGARPWLVCTYPSLG